MKANKGSAAAVFHLKKRIVGNKTEKDDPSMIIDPASNLPIFEPSKIKDICVKYCKSLLTDRTPTNGFDEDVEWKKRVHASRMDERIEHDVEYREEMLYDTLKLLAKKGGKQYEFVLKGGKSLINALNKLYKTIWEVERRPESWKDTMIVQLPKKNKDKTKLDNIRHIHTKPEIQKVFSHIVTNLIKPTIVVNINLFRIGAIPGHRGEEHIFTLKSVVAMTEDNDDAIAVQLLDLVKYYDSEV